MNNQIPFPIPFNSPMPGMNNFENNNEKILHKIERLEKNIRILENRVNKLENNNFNLNDNYNNDDPTDMYIL